MSSFLEFQEFINIIDKNPFGQSCVPTSTKEKFRSEDTRWGAEVSRLTPSRLITAWLMKENPLMLIAGEGYRNTEVRDRSFELQEEAIKNLRGNRKLTKAKMGDALSSLKPTVDQTKVVAAILLALRQIQTVCFDEDTKTVWTVPEDLCAWSSERTTIWVSANCEFMLNEESIHLGRWLSDRENDGWTIDWPIAEGTFEEIKSKMRALDLTPRAVLGAKVKKEDWARALGKAEAIEHLG